MKPYKIKASLYYPEGSFAAWTVVFGAFCGLCGAVETMNTMGLVVTEFSGKLGRGVIALTNSIFAE
jgi:hypothetical protein